MGATVVYCFHMDQAILISWNVRGLNTGARRDAVRVLVDDTRASLVCFQETKLSVISPDVILSMLGMQFSDFAYLPASATRGVPLK